MRNISQQRTRLWSMIISKLRFHYARCACILSASTLIALPRARFAGGCTARTASWLTFGDDVGRGVVSLTLE